MKIARRKFIETTITILGGIPLSGIVLSGDSTIPESGIILSGDSTSLVRFGIFTDTHYADRESSGTRYYRESLSKLSECVDLMNEERVDFLIELGDFKDQGDPPEETETLRFLGVIEKEYSRFKGARYHTLGNHDHDSVSKSQFLQGISNTGFSTAQPYYSFDSGSVHFVVLDANYTSNGRPYDHGNFDWTDAFIPGKQLRWLKKDLAETSKPAVVFIHHRLDITAENKIYGPSNADKIRSILEKSGKVIIVFQGHEHGGSINRINNIPYYTLKGMVEGSGSENNSYIITTISQDLTVTVKGYRKAVSDQFLSFNL